MILPFVRDLLAGLEHSQAFERARRHLAGGSGRRRISGLTATARGLYLPMFVRAAHAPALVLVADNKAAEALHATVLASCELTGALTASAVLRLPAHDVLPFESLSPHAEIQEMRASALWKIASGRSDEVRLVIAPVEAACMRLFARDHYTGLALRLKVGEEHLPEMVVEHLLSVGYTRVDVVELPGQVTLRGGILDVFSPESERPVRVDFFGDEIESIRRFDPDTQRSSVDDGPGAAAAADRDAGDGAAAGRDQCAADADGVCGGCGDGRRRGAGRVADACAGPADGGCDGVSGVGVFRAGGRGDGRRCWSLMGPKNARVCGRAGDGGQPGRALVEQGGAAA